MSTVVPIRPADTVLTKRQLADHLGRSERWVELKMQQGMPSIRPTKRFGAARFVLRDVEGWLAAGVVVRERSLRDRVADLERLLEGLVERIERMESA